MTDIGAAGRARLLALLSDCGQLLDTPVGHQVQAQVQSDARLSKATAWLAADNYYLVTVVANDERELEDRRHKIYYVFSHPYADLFVIIEYLLGYGSDSYQSIRDQFPAVEPFEREMYDMVGLKPAMSQDTGNDLVMLPQGSWLHRSAFPARLFPLRRTGTAIQLRKRAAKGAVASESVPAAAHPLTGELDGEPTGMILPVGPVHAGIIESGQFFITTSGEVIEDLQLRLGYAHRGIERMFQSYMSLTEGWHLAEQVSGDTSFAHSLAYCRAAEVLTDSAVPPAAKLLRAMFLELERIHNHVADVAGMADDVGMEQLAAEFAAIREEVLRLDKLLTGHRYLRGVNRVGGVQAAGSLDPADVTGVLSPRIDAFGRLARSLFGRSGFRDRTVGVGILTHDEALRLGVTGLIARASGVQRDIRFGHPGGINQATDHILSGREASLGHDEDAVAGDVFARTLVRAREVLTSWQLIVWLAGRWSAMAAAERASLVVKPQIRPEKNYTSAIGYAEGCRGDVVYWLMQDKMHGIYRCKVRDPSMLNWPALRACALPGFIGTELKETLVADFPLLNKSFALSYAGNDL